MDVGRGVRTADACIKGERGMSNVEHAFAHAVTLFVRSCVTEQMGLDGQSGRVPQIDDFWLGAIISCVMMPQLNGTTPVFLNAA